MLKEIWKWVLNQQEEKRINEIVNKIKIEIPGFRKGGKLPPKQIVIMHLLKPKYFQMLSKNSICLIEGLEEIYNIPIMSEEELKLIENIPPSHILIKLLSEKEEEKATSLFHYWKEEYGDEGMQKLEEERQVAMEEWLISSKKENQVNESFIENSSIDFKKMEKINKRLEQKIKSLQEELEHSHLKYKIYKEVQEEKEKLTKNEYQQLKLEYIQLQKDHQNNMSLYEVEKLEWQNDKLALLGQVEELQKELRKIEANVLKQNYEKCNQEKKVQKKIYLLGNPHNQSIFLNCPFEVKIVERSEINQVDFADCQEIWGLSYKLDSQIIKNIQKQTDKPVKKIETFKQLKRELEKGLENFEK